ncbi:TauD/TfdA family dioxygenase [Shewanella surugensis]|uniref:TauD/TfdA family dioxygenase n=1 Tax=Shewanella surugensis TaxID=212020 RepID=A0ABT0LJF9_9GAMM|nr:TauD/TfdA family dioxygenase [Shewanella surugensis]MCL1127847.1 TauD/TfdA family dioxygenase [Shewanella surugensis]
MSLTNKDKVSYGKKPTTFLNQPLYNCLHNVNLNGGLVDDNLSLLFNPFLLSNEKDSIERFKKGEMNFIVFRNTGFNLKDNTISNDDVNTQLASSFIASIFTQLGIFPVTYQGENNGLLFRKVTPIKSFEHTQSSLGAKEHLGFHVDNNHMALSNEHNKNTGSVSPDYLSLFCIRNDEDISTDLSDIPLALSQLSAEEIAILKSPRFRIAYPDSFDIQGDIIAPVIVENEHGLCSRFDSAFTHPIDNEAKIVFNKLNHHLKASTININLDSGDLLIFRNQQMAHSRRSFTPQYNGYDRFLLRVFGVDSLSRVKSVSPTTPYYSIAV